MSELDKAIEVLKEHLDSIKLGIGKREIPTAINTVVSTIEQLRDKVNKDEQNATHNLELFLYIKSLKGIIGG